MKLNFVFYGITYGPGGRTGSDRDIQHCWPNLQDMLIMPFIYKGYDVSVSFSTYPFTDPLIENNFKVRCAPVKIVYSQFEGSDPFTTKIAAFDAIDETADLVCITRSDIHWSKRVAHEFLHDPMKFYFLFPEGDGWWDSWRFTCDNFYLFPRSMAETVRKAMLQTYAWPRGKPYVDTHGLLNKLDIPFSQIGFVSTQPEISDVNSFYTCCRSGLPDDGRGGYIHPEVQKRFNYSDESSDKVR